MYNSLFINKVKILFKNFPNHQQSGLGRSKSKSSKFRKLLQESEYSHLLKYSDGDAYYLICVGKLDFPQCPRKGCLNKITGRSNPKFCSMACYKADEFTADKISRAKTTLDQNPEWKSKVNQKRKTKCLEKYGCEHPMQNPDVFELHEKSSFQAKTHLGMTGLRGYEPQVLDYFVSLGFRPNKDIVQGTSALTAHSWRLIGKNGNYQMPDFYLPAYATFVEVKSDYTLTKDWSKISELPGILEEFGAEYLIVLVNKDGLHEVDLKEKSTKKLDLSRISRTMPSTDALLLQDL